MIQVRTRVSAANVPCLPVVGGRWHIATLNASYRDARAGELDRLEVEVDRLECDLLVAP